MNPNCRATIKVKLFLTILSIVLVGLAANVRSTFASQLVQVALSDVSKLEQLQRAGLEVTFYSQGGLAEVILMNSEDRERLNNTGLPYFVSIHDIESFNRLRLGPGRDDMGGYRTFDEIVAEMIRLHEAYPDIISSPAVIGTTIEDRPLLAIKVSDNPEEDENEPEALFTSLIHCREVVTSYILFGVIEQLAEGYGEDERLTRLVDERQIWFIPVVNPDGYVFNEEDEPDGGGMWRKNRRRNEGGSYGVDLNRNFGSHWGYDNTGSSPIASNDTYRGTEAFSEPETDAIRQFVIDRRFTVSIFFHSYSNLCLFPYGYEVIQPPDRSVFSALSKKMIAVNHYLPGTGWEVIYRTNGDSDDWLYSDDDHDPIFAFTIEVGSREDYFWPPLERVEPLVAENIEAVLTLIEYADNPARVLAPPIPEITTATITPSGHLSVRWTESDDDINPAVFYRLKTVTPGEPIVDEALPNDARWDKVNFNMSQVNRHSGTHSFRAALQSPMSTMTLIEPIVIPDTITAWINYELRSNRSHCIALEASEDGYSWQPLRGERTQDFVVNQHSIGHGITGSSGGWVETYWNAGEFAGKTAKLRFRYYSFNNFPNPPNTEFCYIDDIFPIPTAANQTIIADEIDQPAWDGDTEDFGIDRLYFVEAIDSDGDVSFSSDPVHAEPIFDPLVLRCEPTWSLVSAPYDMEDPSLATIFALWIERESLLMIKDGYGSFFLPSMNFDQIREWNPLAGYYVRVIRADSLLFPGEHLADDTEIIVPQGWSTISYLPGVPMQAGTALTSIAENLVFAKNGFGEFWAVDQEFSNLREIEPGAGLLIKMRTADTLIYVKPPEEPQMAPAHVNSPLPDYSPDSPFNMSVILTFPPDFPDGQIVFVDSDGFISGGIVVETPVTRAGVAVWEEERSGSAGYAAGEPLKAIWRSNSGIESEIELKQVYGSKYYRTNELACFIIVTNDFTTPQEFSLSAFPNPFNGRTTINIGLSEVSEVDLEIFDIQGRSVFAWQSGKLPAGDIRYTWDAAELPAGIYVAKTASRNERTYNINLTKLLLIK